MGHVWPQEQQLDAILITILSDGQSKVVTEAVNDKDDRLGEDGGKFPLPGNSI